VRQGYTAAGASSASSVGAARFFFFLRSERLVNTGDAPLPAWRLEALAGVGAGVFAAFAREGVRKSHTNMRATKIVQCIEYDVFFDVD